MPQAEVDIAFCDNCGATEPKPGNMPKGLHWIFMSDLVSGGEWRFCSFVCRDKVVARVLAAERVQLGAG